jgi:hypothetical protein
MRRFKETEEMNTLAQAFVCNSIGIKEHAKALEYSQEAEDRLRYLLYPFYIPKHDPYPVYLDSCTFADIWSNNQGKLECGNVYFKVMKPRVRMTAFSWAFLKRPICFLSELYLERVPGEFFLGRPLGLL